MVVWQKIYKEQALRMIGSGGDEAKARQADRLMKTYLKARGRNIYSVNKIWAGTNTWWVPLTFLPVWIVNADCVRRMSGDDRTFLSMFLPDNHDKVDTSIIPVEPGFQAESLWWLPDLLSPDPYWALPVTWGALFFANVYNYGGRDLLTGATLRRLQAMPEGTTKRVQTVFYWLAQFQVALSVFLPYCVITAGLPTSVMLYFIGSSATMLIQRPVVNWLVGAKPITVKTEPMVPKPIKALPASLRVRQPLQQQKDNSKKKL
jgi:hypothetical protein